MTKLVEFCDNFLDQDILLLEIYMNPGISNPNFLTKPEVFLAKTGYNIFFQVGRFLLIIALQ